LLSVKLCFQPNSILKKKSILFTKYIIFYPNMYLFLTYTVEQVHFSFLCGLWFMINNLVPVPHRNECQLLVVWCNVNEIHTDEEVMVGRENALPQLIIHWQLQVAGFACPFYYQVSLTSQSVSTCWLISSTDLLFTQQTNFPSGVGKTSGFNFSG